MGAKLRHPRLEEIEPEFAKLCEDSTLLIDCL